MTATNCIATALLKRRADIEAKWSGQLTAMVTGTAKGRISTAEIIQQSRNFLDVFSPAVQSGKLDDIYAPEWSEVRTFLDDLSRRRVLAGFSSDETATFIFSLKRPVFDALKDESASDPKRFADEIWNATLLLDSLGLRRVRSVSTSTGAA